MAKRGKVNLGVARSRKAGLAAVVDDAVHDPTVRAVAASAAVAAGGALAAGRLVRDRAHERAELREARSYRLLPGEPVAEGVRRIARGQLDSATELLEHSGTDALPDSIHAARKALKRLRALLRVARDALGEETYSRENAIFRDAGRDLSPVRDAQVTVAALEQLTNDFAAELPEGAFAALDDALRGEAMSAHERLQGDRQALAATLEALRASRDRVASWPLRDDAGLRALAPGLQRIYRRGRRALRDARHEPSTEHLHELRKRAKDLWHAGQMLSPIAPKKMKPLRRGAHRLSDVVGEDHDLAVLLDRARERAQSLDPRELELLTALVARRRARLQRRALGRARRIYADRPRKLRRWIPAAQAVPG